MLLRRLWPAAALLAACGAEPQPAKSVKTSPAAAAVAEQLGADPASVESQVVKTADGETVKVTTFQRPAPTGDQSAALKAACDGGDQKACTEFGATREYASDHAGAEEVWKSACEAGESEACHRLGNMLGNPFLKLGRDADALQYFEKACTMKHMASCYFLGGHHDFGRLGLEPDPKKARVYYEQGCEHGHHWACQKVQPGPGKAGSDCASNGCETGLWCIQDQCAAPPA